MRPAVPRPPATGPRRFSYPTVFALPTPESAKYDSQGDSGISIDLASTSSSESTIVQPIVLDENTSKELYHDTYGHPTAHEAFLRDQAISHAFYKAIYDNHNVFEGKIVLNIGCGVGAYALLAASAGAAHVFAIDKSSIVNYTRSIVEFNKRSHKITVIQGAIEEIELPVKKVDIILCDWLGYGFFFNSLISSVLFAREKWLINGGVIYPDKARLHIAGVENQGRKFQRVDWWKSVYEFDMSVLRQYALKEPVIATVKDKTITTTSCCFAQLDLNTMSAETELDFPFRLNALSDTHTHAFVTYFDVLFSRSFQQVTFSTGPLSPRTVYSQTSFFLDKDLSVKQGETISGRFKVKEMKPNKTAFEIQVDCDGEDADYHEAHEFIMAGPTY